MATRRPEAAGIAKTLRELNLELVPQAIELGPELPLMASAVGRPAAAAVASGDCSGRGVTGPVVARVGMSASVHVKEIGGRSVLCVHLRCDRGPRHKNDARDGCQAPSPRARWRDLKA